MSSSRIRCTSSWVLWKSNGLRFKKRKNGARDLFFLGEEVVCVCVFAMGNTEAKTKEVARARCLGFFWRNLRISFEQCSVHPGWLGFKKKGWNITVILPNYIGIIWMFPKIMVPPNHSILIWCSIINHPFWGVSPYFLETSIWIVS